jgi:hypothetical protein
VPIRVQRETGPAVLRCAFEVDKEKSEELSYRIARKKKDAPAGSRNLCGRRTVSQKRMPNVTGIIPSVPSPSVVVVALGESTQT